MNYFLGVDGGGTKTKFILCNNTLNIINSISREGSDYHNKGIEKVCQNFKTGLQQLITDLGITNNDIKSATWGIPCYGETKEIDEKINKYLTSLLPKTEQQFCNDVDIAIAGSLELANGIHIVSGTGAIIIGRDSQGNTVRCSGWDEHFGDEGSSYWLGNKALSLFTQEADGRREKGPLYDILRKNLHLKNDFDLIRYYHEELLEKRDKIAQLQFYLYQAAKENDKAAIELYKKAAEELAFAVISIITKLKFDKKVLVSYSGGTFKAGDLILQPLKEYLKSYNLQFIQPKHSPEIGALLLASSRFVDKKYFCNLNYKNSHRSKKTIN